MRTKRIEKYITQNINKIPYDIIYLIIEHMIKSSFLINNFGYVKIINDSKKRFYYCLINKYIYYKYNNLFTSTILISYLNYIDKINKLNTCINILFDKTNIRTINYFLCVKHRKNSDNSVKKTVKIKKNKKISLLCEFLFNHDERKYFISFGYNRFFNLSYLLYDKILRYPDKMEQKNIYNYINIFKNTNYF